ncbi:uncharacterized protein LOC112203593 [Rosa chinensis]|uniref:uncharacterized protein LOC112203593 n=1 Tax=Rosa chinensis TaxID=74649 RepID=UPI000D08C7E2|nr:uncharacterized protein LOC112203593 [Rosa chinensis]
MAAQSIRELSSSIVTRGIPTCIITYPAAAQGLTAEFKLKSGLLNRLPIFHGLSMEDPYKHLMEFQFICTSMKPQGADENILKLKAFPFSLADRAKDWLYELPSGHITSWDAMMKVFLEKYFPTSRIIMLKKKISGITRAQNESYSAYYERFKSLLAQCPQHIVKDENLLTCFYEGLLPLERQMIDATSGDSSVDKSPAEGKALIANCALNTQQVEDIGSSTRARVNGIRTNSLLEDKIDKLTSLVSQALTTKGQALACRVCSMQGHVTNQCPQLIENGGWESANSVGFQQGQNRPQTYNEGWRNHPNFRWKDNDNVGNPNQNINSYNRAPPGFYQKPQDPLNSTPLNSSSSNPNYDKMFEALTSSTQALIQSQKNQAKDIADLKRQMVILSKLHEQGKLPSNTIPNPKAQYESAKAVTLRNGRVLDDATKGIRNVTKDIRDVTKDKDSVLTSSKALQKDPAMFNCEAGTSCT